MTNDKVIVAYQGEPGCYSEEAAAQFFGEEVLQESCVPVTTFDAVFAALYDGRATRAVLPIENVIAGTINRNLDLILSHTKVNIIGEVDVAVRHCLLARTDCDDRVHSVRSHYMALTQCDLYISKHNIRAEVADDTAGAARALAALPLEEARGCGAVASARAAKRYGLRVVARGIEDSPGNYTRFWVLSTDSGYSAPVPCPPTLRAKTSIAFTLDNGPGRLVDALLSLRCIDMTKIESRPIHSMGKMFTGAHGKKLVARWHYIFYVEIAGSTTEEEVEMALVRMREQTAFLRVLGSYKRHDVIYRGDDACENGEVTAYGNGEVVSNGKMNGDSETASPAVALS